MKCPTCGHDVKYGYIEPVKRNDVLDKVVQEIKSKMFHDSHTRREAIKAVLALKDT